MGVEPGLPGRPARGVQALLQPRYFVPVPRMSGEHGTEAFHESGRGHRNDLLAQNRDGTRVRVRAVVGFEDDVEARRHQQGNEVVVVDHDPGRDPVAERARELREDGMQKQGRHLQRGADNEAGPVVAQPLAGGVQAVHRRLDGEIVGFAAFRQGDASASSLEQRHPQGPLQRTDATADCRVRRLPLFGGAGDAAEPSRRLEGLQRVDGRKLVSAADHGQGRVKAAETAEQGRVRARGGEDLRRHGPVTVLG